MRYLALGLVLAGITAGSVSAAEPVLNSNGWRFTHWGMTPQQVAAASGGEAHEDPGTPGDHVGGKIVGAKSLYSTGDYHFAVTYYFGDHGLDYIMLHLQDSTPDRCMKLSLDLQGKYGAADGKPGDTFITWKVKPSNTSLGVTNLGGADCALSYSQLVTPSASGL